MPERRKTLHAALCDAFVDFEELRIAMSLELGDRLNDVAANLTLEAGAYKLIRWAETRGRTADLIAAVRKTRAGNPLVQALTTPLSKQHRVFTSRLPAVNPLLVGREKELAFLDAAWANPAANIIQIIASGGTGKTAIVDKWFRAHLGEAHIFGWSFYSQGTSEERSQTSSDPFFAELLRWLGLTVEPTASVYAKAEAVAERLRAERVLLLLDGLEPLQNASGDMKDAAMKALLAELDTSNAGLVVCTTRVRITELPDDAPRAQSIELDNLTPGAGGAYLEKLGVQGEPEELRKASADYGNHALALTLLGKYLVKFCGKDVRRLIEIPKLAIRQLGKPAEHARRMIAAYEGALKGSPELEVLKALGYFDRPADKPALDLVLPKLDPLDYQAALDRLRDLRLVLADDLDCHPLIREHFAESATTEGHSGLYEYYAKQAPHQPDTEEAMRPLFHAIYHGCRAGRYAEALRGIHQDRVRRGNEAYLIKKLGLFGTDLSVLANFFTIAWCTPVKKLSVADQSWLISEAGFGLRALGRLADALEPIRAGADRCVLEKSWANAAGGYNNLSELFLTLGRVQEANAFARNSVEFADRTRRWDKRGGSRTTLAEALHQAGDHVGAAALFAEAEQIQIEDHPRSANLYSLNGFRYCDLLLAQGNAPEARHRATQTLEWARKQGSLLDLALNHLTLARAGDPATHLAAAIDGLRRAGTLEFLPLGLLARGTQHDLDEIFKIATRSGMKLHLTDAHLAQARLYLKEGRRDDARPHVDKAAALITETGYHRRDPELAELHAALGPR